MSQEELSETDHKFLQKWGSEEVAKDFIEKQYQKINKTCFGGELSKVEIEIRPMIAKEGEILFGHSSAGAEYRSKESVVGAKIILYSVLLLEEELAITVLAHELVHHWEHTMGNFSSAVSYPVELDHIISQHFSDIRKEGSWRSGHSDRFLSKIYEVAVNLNLSLKDILFHAQ